MLMCIRRIRVTQRGSVAAKGLEKAKAADKLTEHRSVVQAFEELVYPNIGRIRLLFE